MAMIMDMYQTPSRQASHFAKTYLRCQLLDHPQIYVHIVYIDQFAP